MTIQKKISNSSKKLIEKYHPVLLKNKRKVIAGLIIAAILAFLVYAYSWYQESRVVCTFQNPFAVIVLHSGDTGHLHHASFINRRKRKYGIKLDRDTIFYKDNSVCPFMITLYYDSTQVEQIKQLPYLYRRDMEAGNHTFSIKVKVLETDTVAFTVPLTTFHVEFR